jgi:hypothetical protein
MTLLEVIVLILALTSIPFLFVFLNISSLWVFQSFISLLEKPNISAFKQLIVWLVISAITSILLIIAIAIVRLYLDTIVGWIYIFILTH